MGKSYIPKTKVEKLCYFCHKAFLTAKDRQRFCTETCRLDFIKKINELGCCPHCGGDLLRG